MRSDERNERKGMIARVSDVMAAFNADEPVLRVSEIARRTGLAKSVTSRIVADLLEVDFLEPAGKGVRVGIRMFELGELAQRSKELRQLALGAMADLRQATGLTVQLSVLKDTDQVYVEILRGRGGAAQLEIKSRIGGRVPAYATAGGKAVLAALPDDEIERVLSGPLEKLGPGTITDPVTLRRQIAQIRNDGVAYEIEESNPGVTCAAAAILRADRSPLAAISVTGPSAEINVKVFGIAVQTAALGLNRRIRASSAFSDL
ncbi:IclR family transcriptional regulator [Microbacterium sp. NPDC078428]|uniref:IclR family transcriptional regulator n=1 Tax=Microbacterium sp. NPDC078428 TaxID=3364190 RepID=UPI0037C63774